MRNLEQSEQLKIFGLQQAIELATDAHKDQKDKGSGAPYIGHCLRVMKALAPYGEDYQIVGVLHDSIEDTWITPEYLIEQGMNPELVDDVLAVTKREDEDYSDLVRRAKSRPRSKVVKLADNFDNSNEERLARFEAPKAETFRDKYRGARAILFEDDPWLQAQAPLIKGTIDALNAAA